MSDHKDGFCYFADGVSFASGLAAYMREIYMPLCAPQSDGIKSSITPFLSGDIKLDKAHYLTKPASRQDLRNPVRNFFVRTQEGEIFSLLDREDDAGAEVQVGQLWHRLINRSQRMGLELEVLNFVPVSGGRVEIMQVAVRNIADKVITVTPIGCVPIFGRSLVNKHDHEHVTSLLHRIEQLDQGVLVSPTMSFNEEGHQVADMQYFVFGAQQEGGLPQGSFPTVESFLGDASVWERPCAVIEGRDPIKFKPEDVSGKEAAGAVCFQQTSIAPGEEKFYIMMAGISQTREEALQVYARFDTVEKVGHGLVECRNFWTQKSNSISMKTGDQQFDSWMRWVMIQPVLRRIFGCSFLPDHDYGKGGKGWRDLWQDLLSLILIEPETVRQALINNFAGVRIDGTNATIIGSEKGEFIADRNAITRVWMDHGAWPIPTVMLYIDQTGDEQILFEKNVYFRDLQLSRTLKKDEDWSIECGNHLQTKSGGIYQGSLLEHMLVQTLTQFFNVGEHNMLRLESADWNDGLDMAFERGESVAFSSFYAGNLVALADLLEYLKKHKNIQTIEVFKEILVLLDSINGGECRYDDVQAKQKRLFEEYCSAVEPQISGETVSLEADLVIQDLRRKSNWLFDKIRRQEKIEVHDGGKAYQWFNGYYDNLAQRVEGIRDGIIRMTLTGQVFAIMSGLADHEEIQNIVASVDAFLKDPDYGGPRLNTDFHVRNYLDLGRAFSFAYGTKENGAVFSHMAVMYAYALYRRGFIREGFKVLDALYRMSAFFESSKIYPNIPEYFDSKGRGMYSYLTGSASWLVLTVLTQMFGLRGEKGHLVIDPKLVREQFSQKGVAQITSIFAGKTVSVSFYNPSGFDAGEYSIHTVKMNDKVIDVQRAAGGAVCLKRSLFEGTQESVDISVELIENSS